MAEPFLGEIKMISWNFAPRGWAFCDGQLLPINQNQALFSILGTTYGGDGRVNFGLPDLRGRIPVHVGAGISLGEPGGETSHTLNFSEMPQHTHAPVGSAADPSSSTPVGSLPATITADPYSSSVNTLMDPANILPVGGSQPHENLSPYLVLNFIIALQGIFPSQN